MHVKEETTIDFGTVVGFLVFSEECNSTGIVQEHQAKFLVLVSIYIPCRKVKVGLGSASTMQNFLKSRYVN